MRVECIAQRDKAATASRISCLATGYSEGFRPTDAGVLQQATNVTQFIYVQEISGSVELYIMVTYLTGAVLAAIATKWNHTANQALNSSHEDGIHLLPICPLRVKVTNRHQLWRARSRVTVYIVEDFSTSL